MKTLPATVVVGGAERTIPASYLGLSMEYNELPLYEQAGAAVDHAIGLLATVDRSRMLLRVGGLSADRAWWRSPGEPPVPHGVFGFGRPWLDGLAALVARDRLQVLLDLNLAVHSPTMVKSLTAAAARALGPALVGAEIGNEPDHYYRQPALTRQVVAATEPGVTTRWTHGYTSADYRRDYLDYAKSLKQVSSRLWIGGPGLATALMNWGTPLAGLGRLHPNFISVHRYAGSNCWAKTSPRYPSVPRLLSESVSSELAGSLHGMIAFATGHQMAVRVTELGTVSCGGSHGVADSFATALWAPDLLFELLRAGVAGVNFHLRPSLFNAPFTLSGTAIEPRPVLYGLAAFAAVAAGTHPVLSHATVTGPGLHLKAWAVRQGGQLRVLLLNKGRRTASVTMQAAQAHSASLVRLTAPSPRATSGVRFGGRRIGSDGKWHGSEQIQRLPIRGGLVHMVVPGGSAAVLTLSA